MTNWSPGARGVVHWQLRYLCLQVLYLKVRVAPGGGDPGVAQQLLHRPQIGPGAQSMGGEGVAQQMRAGAIGDAARAQVAVHQDTPRRTTALLCTSAECARKQPTRLASGAHSEAGWW